MLVPAAFPAFFPAQNRAAVMAKLRRLLHGHNGLHNRFHPLSFGLPALDSHLPQGGLTRGALHEIVPAAQVALPAAFGFLVAILARLSSPSPEAFGKSGASGTAHPSPPRRGGKPLFFIMPAYGLGQCGRLSEHLSGHGLNGLGLDPSRAVLVETAHRKETLWALVEVLRSGAPQAVAGTIDQLDLKTSQKLHLAATDAGLPLLLLRPSQTLESSAAATRWRVGTAQAARDRFGIYARPRWRLQLERCRNGRPGEWVVEYDHVTHRFNLVAALADPSLSCGTGDQSLRQAGRS